MPVAVRVLITVAMCTMRRLEPQTTIFALDWFKVNKIQLDGLNRMSQGSTATITNSNMSINLDNRN